MGQVYTTFKSWNVHDIQTIHFTIIYMLVLTQYLEAKNQRKVFLPAYNSPKPRDERDLSLAMKGPNTLNIVLLIYRKKRGWE